MGVIIITASEADTVVLAEVARRFDCKVDFRFGDYVFDDNVIGISKVVPAKTTEPTESKQYQATTKSLKYHQEEVNRITRLLKNHRR